MTGQVEGCAHDRFVCARCTRAASSAGPGAPGVVSGSVSVFTAPRSDTAAITEHLAGHADTGRRPGWVRRRG